MIRQLAANYSIQRLCQVLKVHPSGYYAWCAEPRSARAKDDQRLLGLIKHSWLESGGVYGYRKIHADLRELGEYCGRHCVARLMRAEGLRSQTGYRWRRKPKQEVMIHSDQGSQFSSSDWQSFLRANNLVGSMSRCGNCHDNAVAESFFQLLKCERIKRRIYRNRDEARSDVFYYIEMFYNPKRRHSVAEKLSPIEFERRYFLRQDGL